MRGTAKGFWATLVISAVVAGCSEHQLTGLSTTSPTTARAAVVCDSFDCTPPDGGGGTVSSDPFFLAWSPSYFITDPIQTQQWALDSRVYRQPTNFPVDGSVLAFASANPGKLYIIGDEPDGSCITPDGYAQIYHDNVAAIRGADPTAHFSPAGISDPSDVCCPPPGGEPCRTTMHWVSYADQFYNAYVQRYGVAPPVDEWRFHNFAQWIGPGEVTTWWAQVRDAADWSAGGGRWGAGHGAHMVLGSWGFIGWKITAAYPMSEYLGNMRQAMDYVRNDGRINQAVWWAWEQTCCLDDGTPYRHNLRADDNTLTVEGLTYANMSPIDLAIQTQLHTGQNQMRGVWTNRSTTHAIEVQFFSYDGSNWIPTSDPMWQPPGAIATPYYGFPSGARVRFWARYITSAGAGPWSALSGDVIIP